MSLAARLLLAREAGLVLPDAGVALWGLGPEDGPTGLSDPLVISRDARVHDRVPRALERVPGPVPASIVSLPREKARARAWLAEAAAATAGPLIVDGQKTHGIEPMLKALRARADVAAALSKAHGKIVWMQAAPDLSDWAARPGDVEGWRTWPGVFSADGVDPGSRLLAEALPARLGPAVVDLGAGWGWLSAQIATRGRNAAQDAQPELHLVETDGDALDCARHNVPGARCHWADVTRWQAPQRFDTVVMNPPFHTGRAGDPALGRAFITKAAEVLQPGGDLYMVANRHLPYEETLSQNFARLDEIGGDGRYKLLHAARPRRARR